MQISLSGRSYFEDLRVGLESLNASPQSDEEKQEIFNIKRQTVQTLVGKVSIGKDRKIEVTFHLNILKLIGYQENFSETRQAEIYNRRPASLVRLHPSGFAW